MGTLAISTLICFVKHVADKVRAVFCNRNLDLSWLFLAAVLPPGPMTMSNTDSIHGNLAFPQLPNRNMVEPNSNSLSA